MKVFKIYPKEGGELAYIMAEAASMDAVKGAIKYGNASYKDLAVHMEWDNVAAIVEQSP